MNIHRMRRVRRLLGAECWVVWSRRERLETRDTSGPSDCRRDWPRLFTFVLFSFSFFDLTKLTLFEYSLDQFEGDLRIISLLLTYDLIPSIRPQIQRKTAKRAPSELCRSPLDPKLSPSISRKGLPHPENLSLPSSPFQISNPPNLQQVDSSFSPPTGSSESFFLILPSLLLTPLCPPPATD